jgi:hypothetical protein
MASVQPLARPGQRDASVNLLNETISILRDHGKTSNDVEWVGTRSRWFTWDEFASVANIEYDEGFGCAQVAVDLLVVGRTWWLERREYDGSEWWEFKQLLPQPAIHAPPRSLVSGMWSKLDEIETARLKASKA